MKGRSLESSSWYTIIQQLVFIITRCPGIGISFHYLIMFALMSYVFLCFIWRADMHSICNHVWSPRHGLSFRLNQSYLCFSSTSLCRLCAFPPPSFPGGPACLILLGVDPAGGQPRGCSAHSTYNFASRTLPVLLFLVNTEHNIQLCAYPCVCLFNIYLSVRLKLCEFRLCISTDFYIHWQIPPDCKWLSQRSQATIERRSPHALSREFMEGQLSSTEPGSRPRMRSSKLPPPGEEVYYACHLYLTHKLPSVL